MSAVRLLAGTSVVALLHAGCVTAPHTADRPAEMPPPASWTAIADGAASSAAGSPTHGSWVATFGDNTLAALVDEALARNLDLRAFAFAVESARATATIAGAEKYPWLGAGLDASRNQVAVPNGSGGANSVVGENHSLGLSLSWEIDLWGRLRNGEQAAIADVQAAEADLSAARLSIAGAVAKAWFRASTSRLQLNLAEETVRNFDATADLVRSRFETGISTSLELRLALANAASAHALLDQRRQELDGAVRVLETLVGRYPANAFGIVDTLPELAVGVPVGLPAELLARRPDIVAAERRVAAADARTREARRAQLPSLRLTGFDGTASADLEDLLDADFEVWSIAAGLAQPLFQGGRLRAASRRASALAERTHVDYLNTIITAFREVETALAAEELLRRQELNVREFAEHSAGAERLARDEYEAGLSDIITVLESQRRALDARSSHLFIREERLRNRVDLHLALGGDFATSSAAAATVASAR